MEKDQADHPSFPAPVRLAFRVSYLGSRFFGSQMQVSERTVEGEFVAACERLSLFPDWREAGFLFAGRTDRGVHAIGQVAAFSTDAPERAITALNLQLPPDCWCTAYAEVPPAFHPRYDAKKRTYRYFFSSAPPRIEEMARAAARFIGNHNFSSFARMDGRSPFRTVYSAQVLEEGGFVCLEVTAESFLWHQVRCMATALLRIGEGEEEDLIDRLLTGEPEKALSPAPAEGLVLWDTDCGICWKPIIARERSARFINDLVRHHSLMGTVCQTLQQGLPPS
ncbi:tRNA pseudouridine(38-40) synthase TruA [Methanoregula sp.]|uniref:tRNA pseudouridine(38-40) synthase TruA n=1 Tax=Methanoregula sp. TaxID=2052170 RepID=UPI000CAB816F|nr:tRNA pseudouridine(38-40) synthase TruA [Methanoregula sp.]PKG32817.1 MAG: tRNA pseudouridine(38-40) synthase TruA [Methanoregula sp.]